MSRWFSLRRSSSRDDMWLKARTSSASSWSSGGSSWTPRSSASDSAAAESRTSGRVTCRMKIAVRIVAEDDPEDGDDARAPGELAGVPDHLLVREVDEHRPDHETAPAAPARS